ncbi:hypothetical protein ACTA71_006213 [Dictyostelium dimigraforme]
MKKLTFFILFKKETKLKEKEEKNITRKNELQKVNEFLIAKNTAAIYEKQVGQKEERIQIVASEIFKVNGGNKELEAKISALGREILQLKEPLEKDNERLNKEIILLGNDNKSKIDEIEKLKEFIEKERSTLMKQNKELNAEIGKLKGKIGSGEIEKEEKNIARKNELQKVKDELLVARGTTAIYEKQVNQKEERIQIVANEIFSANGRNKELEAKIYL